MSQMTQYQQFVNAIEQLTVHIFTMKTKKTPATCIFMYFPVVKCRTLGTLNVCMACLWASSHVHKDPRSVMCKRLHTEMVMHTLFKRMKEYNSKFIHVVITRIKSHRKRSERPYLSHAFESHLPFSLTLYVHFVLLTHTHSYTQQCWYTGRERERETLQERDTYPN